MSGPKPGDRVRVTYEGVYQGQGVAGHAVTFALSGVRDWTVTVPFDATFEVLPKPLQVGDTVTIGDLPEPPLWTALLYPDTGEVIRREHGGWAFAGVGSRIYQWHTLASHPARVVWLKGATS